MSIRHYLAGSALALACGSAFSDNDGIAAAQMALDNMSAPHGIYIVAVDALWQHARQTVANDGTAPMDLVFQELAVPCGAEAPRKFHVKLVPLRSAEGDHRVDAYLSEEPCTGAGGGEAAVAEAAGDGDLSAKPAANTALQHDANAEDSYELDLGHGSVQTLNFGQRSISISFTGEP